MNGYFFTGIPVPRLFSWGIRKRYYATGSFLLAYACLIQPLFVTSAEKSSAVADNSPTQSTLEATRLTMEKWIETQQIISKERKEWQQGKEILLGRLELIDKELSTLQEKIKQAESSVAESDRSRNALLAENDQIKAAGSKLTDAVIGMEGKIQLISNQLPESVKTRLQPLYQRIPIDATNTRVSTAERFQNVLGILNELNKTNNEITVSYEVQTLADGKPSEVKAIYIGLAQAYYVSMREEAGIGRPSSTGWVWEPANSIARRILMALEILQGKHTPAFVPLPIKIQ